MYKFSIILILFYTVLNIMGNSLQNGKACTTGTECSSEYCNPESFRCTIEPTRILVYKLSEFIKKDNLSFDIYNILKQLEKTPSSSATNAGSSLGSAIGGQMGAKLGGVVGGLINPIAYLLKIGHLNLSPELKEFEKLLEDLINRIIVTLSNKITEEDIKAFTEKVFIFAKTASGKNKIIDILSNFNTLDSLREKAKKNIIIKNNTTPPTNLQQLINEKTAHELENFAQEFKAFGKQISLTGYLF